MKKASKSGITPKVKLVETSGKILLSEEELATLRTKQQELVVLKVDLANLVLTRQKFEESIQDTSDKILDKEDEYLTEAKKIAMDHGIDTDLPGVGKWNLNLDEKTLNKI